MQLFCYYLNFCTHIFKKRHKKPAFGKRRVREIKIFGIACRNAFRQIGM